MRASKFADEYEAMVSSKDVMAGDMAIIVHAAARAWVRQEVCITGRVNTAAVYNNALAMAGLRAFADRYGFQTQLWSPDRSRSLDVPAWTTFARQPGDFLIRPPLFGPVWNALQWAQAERGIQPEEMLDNGIRILGAFAVMPEGSLLVAVEQGSNAGGHPTRHTHCRR